MNNNRGGCSYKEFLVCNPKEYDGKGSTIVYTRWIEKMELVQDMSRCGDAQKVKYTVGSFVVFDPSNEIQKLETDYGTTSRSGLSNVAYTNRFHEWLRFIENFSKIAKPLTVLTQKSKTFDWGEKQENAFQTLKDKLCNAPVLALPDGPEDFVVYCDASGLGLGCVLMQRGKIGLFGDYDCEIRYHPGKANVVADALSRKERVKPKRVRAMNLTLQSSIKDMILAAQKEASDEFAGLQKGIDKRLNVVVMELCIGAGMKKAIAVYVKERVEISKREFKKLKRSRIAIVKRVAALRALGYASCDSGEAKVKYMNSEELSIGEENDR
ncbi:putative reverse transcriptase domain-containing protein [Tanacetum coccineum]